ncbi:MAG: response regulator [Planctomycetes bacterium]|nr:response regulator [Planctomycetota bacterium]
MESSAPELAPHFPPSDDRTTGARHVLPKLALVVALCASLLLAASAGLTIQLAYERTGELAAREHQVHALTAQIRYLDEVLTMSACMSAATGEPRWQARYDAHVTQLDDAIVGLRELAPLLFDREVGEDTDAANVRLVAMETHAFELVAAGRRAEARAVLDGEAYARDKELYAAGNQRAQDALIEWAGRENEKGDRRLAMLAVLSLGLGVVTSIAWIAFAHGERDRRTTAALAQERARSLAEQVSNRAKSQFVAHMSHELRTPMTAILGYAEVLRDGGAESAAERAAAVETIHRNGEHLLAIINDILDVSKIEAGAMTVERIDVDPRRVVDDLGCLMEVRARAKGIAFERIVETALPRSIPCDPLRLRQILINLVGNAIKFTDKGGVTLRVRVDKNAADASLAFAVEDTGIGMNAEQLARVFRPFAQADETMARRFGGTGLGLTISTHLAECIGGKLVAASEPGRGSVFTLTLPLGPVAQLEFTSNEIALDAVAGPLPTSPSSRTSAASPLAAASSSDAAPAPASVARDTERPLAGARILLAEDGRDNQRLIALHLRRAGAEVTVVDDGRRAVDAVLGEEPDRAKFDLVLMDMQMPELDGYDATRRLREAGCALPVIALTAHTMAGDRERCLRSGCDDFLSKPIDRRALVLACVAWRNRSDVAAAARAASGKV